MAIMAAELPLETWRKRLLWRACHRGIKEMDILVGGYALRELPDMAAEQLHIFESLMDVPDQDLLAYATGQAEVPAALDGAILRGILAFRTA